MTDKIIAEILKELRETFDTTNGYNLNPVLAIERNRLEDYLKSKLSQFQIELVNAIEAELPEAINVMERMYQHEVEKTLNKYKI